MKHNLIISAFSILLAIGNIQNLSADVETTKKEAIPLQNLSLNVSSTTVQASTTTVDPITTPKSKIKIKDSKVCQKCKCDLDSFQIDCSNKSMSTLFSDEEWQTLQNGDVTFEVIKMDHNEISFIPVLPKYPVKSLYLSFNKINNISSGAFQNLSQLKVLDLSNNNLTSKSLTPEVFKGMYATTKYEPLKNLKTLDLAYNSMHALNSDIFEHIPDLEILILCKNSFIDIDTSTTIAISSLNSLKTLDLSYMEISDLPDTIFHNPIELETLILTGNLFKTIPAALSRARHLKKLVLDENPIKDIDNVNVFKSLAELEFLSISYLPDVTKIGPWALSDMQSLKTLVATNNPRLVRIHEFAFAKNTSNPDIFSYPPLEKLFLNNNNLTSIEHNWIDHWEKITQLDLRYNPWDCQCSNRWLIYSLMKQINNTTPLLTNDVTCATPSAWKGKLLIELSNNKKELLCESESYSGNGNLIWVGILVGVLIGIPLTFVGLVFYRKSCFGFLTGRKAVADRSLYNRANFADEFHI